MRLLGGVVAGIAAGGGIALLINRSIAAADSIGKLADAIGVSTDTLQELRYAAGLAGVSTGQLDGALVAFSKRVGEARSGTGTLITLLQKMDPALLANVQAARTVDEAFETVMRRAASLGNTLDRNALLAAAFGRTAGPLMANLIDDGIQSLDALRERARDLGIVLDEELIRNAEKAKDEMDTLGTVISANVTRAVLGLAPALADLSTWLANVAVDTGDAYEKLKLIAEGDFNFEGLSLSATRRQVKDLREEMVELAKEINAMPDITPPAFFEDPLGFLANIPARVVGADRESKIGELNEVVANWRQWKTKYEWDLKQERKRREKRDAAKTEDPLEGDPVKSPEDIAAAQERARRLLQIETGLNNQLFQLRHQGAERIRAEHLKLVTELQHLIKPDGSNLDEVERLLIGAAAVRDDKLTRLADREKLVADRRAQANQRVAESLGFELEALRKTDRQRFVDVALRRLSAEATPKQREEVERLAGALHDEQQAIEKRNEAEREANQLRDEGKALTERLRTAQEAYTAEIREYQKLLDAGAIDKETFARASEQADDRMLRSSREWSDGVRRAIRDYLDDATDAAKTFEQATTRALKASEDAFVEWAMTGKFSAKDLFNTIAEEALRAAYRMAVAAPLNNILESIFGAIGGSIFGGTGVATTSSGTPMIGDFPVSSGPTMLAHGGGVIGRDAFPARMVDPRAFDGASRYHRGGIVGGERPIVARSGEGVFTPGQMQALAPVPDAKPEVHVAVNVRNTAPGTRATADWRREAGGDLTLDIVVEQIEAGMARNIGRGQGMAPTLERRYGLNPAAGSQR